MADKGDITQSALMDMDQVFDEIVDPMAVIDTGGRVARANPAFLRLLGLSPPGLIGRDCGAVIHHLFVDFHASPVERLLESGEPFEMEVMVRCPDGETRAMMLRIMPFHRPDGEIIGLIETLTDISGMKRTEARLKESIEATQKSLDGAVQAMGAMVESRDAYTAGHQLRVARISLGIGIILDLDQDTLKCLWTAAMVHDVGKIAVPQEYLSKPDRLTELEFAILKTHPDVGARILEKIAFPWPVAEIVRQHHERLDGSGYPRGLSGAEIHLCARIIGVADVAEAMSSHRPYRPSLGMHRALEELQRQKGRGFETDVVEAFVKYID